MNAKAVGGEVEETTRRCGGSNNPQGLGGTRPCYLAVLSEGRGRHCLQLLSNDRVSAETSRQTSASRRTEPYLTVANLPSFSART